MKKSNDSIVVKYLISITCLHMLGLMSIMAQPGNVFSNESCLKSNTVSDCFTELTWDSEDQFISLIQDTTIAINDPEKGQFFLHYSKIQGNALIELISRKQPDRKSYVPQLQQSLSDDIYVDLPFVQTKENPDFFSLGINKRLSDEQCFLRLKKYNEESFIYLFLNPNSKI